MVWSEQLPFPLEVVNDSGVIVTVIDDEGVHVIGADTQIDIINDPTYGAIIQLWDRSVGVGSAVRFIVAEFPAGEMQLQQTTGSVAFTSAFYGNGTTITEVDQSGSDYLVRCIESTGGQWVGFVDVGQAGASIGLTTSVALYLLDFFAEGRIDANNILTAPLQNTVMTFASTIGGVDSGWQNITLQNAWVTDAVTPQYRIMPDGTCQLRGNIHNGVVGAGTILGTIPAVVAPVVDAEFACVNRNGTLWSCFIEAGTGNIRMFQVAGGGPSLRLDGCRFATSLIG